MNAIDHAASSAHFGKTLARDLTAGLVVFLVAIPLCLGIALASNAPLLSGLVSGIIGGIVVGFISRSHVSVSGPAAGLAAIVAAQIASLGSFEAFLLAVIIAGALQIGLGLAKAGGLAAFLPSGVIKGLLAAIGVLLILKQIPHVLGHDSDPEGDMSFLQPDHENTFSELARTIGDLHPGAAVIGLGSVVLLTIWQFYKPLKKSIVPVPLIVVLFGMLLSEVFRQLGSPWLIQPGHFVQVPIAQSLKEFVGFLQFPDFTQWSNPAIYVAGLTMAIVASLETLLNLEAADRLDPKQRSSPPSRELIAQGVGNMAAGLIGGIPITSVIVRSSVNVNAGAQTKFSAIIHGVMILVSIALFPTVLNMIPLSCLAAILLVTGLKLASPALVKQMWDQGRYQFIPFALTVVAIVFTDLLIGVMIGLATSLGFILFSNLRRPIHRVVEKRLGGDVLHIELSNQVSFLNRAALLKVFNDVPAGGHILLDAQHTDYIDPDVLDLIREFDEQKGPARDIQVSLVGFKSSYQLVDRIQYIDYSSREIQSQLTPAEVLRILKDGHERFRTGQRLSRDLGRQLRSTSEQQHPLAVVLSCIDSRSPTELIFDVGVGDVFSIRIAGNIVSREILGSMEYACAVAGAKLILVLGHTKCGAVTAAVDFVGAPETAASATGCQHISSLLGIIQQSVDPALAAQLGNSTGTGKEAFVNEVSKRNVSRVVEMVFEQSETLDRLHREGRIAIVGAIYNIATGDIEFLPHTADVAV